MPDWIDDAVEIIDALQGAAVSNARRAAIPKPPAGFDGVFCVDCEEELLAYRVQYGLCVDCASHRERVAKVNR